MHGLGPPPAESDDDDGLSSRAERRARWAL